MCWRLLLLVMAATAEKSPEVDDETSRKILGSSVVTSVSVIMDTGNGSKIYADAVGKPVSKPLAASELASPIDLLSPDRYEFYTFNDSGDLVKRLMTLEEIQEIIATGDGEGFTLESFTSNGFMPEKRVNDVVNNVQNVLKEEMETHKVSPGERPEFDTPDVSDSWSMILPAIFGNSGQDIIKPDKPPAHVTPDTIMLDPATTSRPEVSSTTPQISTTDKLHTLMVTEKTPTSVKTTTTQSSSTLNVEIIIHSNSTTERTGSTPPESSPIIEIKPVPSLSSNDLELTKENSKPVSISSTTQKTRKPGVKPSKPMRFTPAGTTKKPIINKVTTLRSTPLITTTSTTPTTTTPSTTTSSTTTTTTTPLPTTQKIVTSSEELDDELRDQTVAGSEYYTSPKRTTLYEETTAATSLELKDNVGTTSEIDFTQTESTVKNPQTIITTTEEAIISTTNANEEISTTTKESATTNLITSRKPEIVSLPSLLEILNQSRYTTTTTEVPIMTSPSGLSTYFIITDDRNRPQAVHDSPSNIDESTTITDKDDLSTLGTEYVPLKTSFGDSGTTEEIKTTTGSDQILDQFLLTSTNIYEINAELAKTTVINSGEDFTSTEIGSEIGTTTLRPKEEIITTTFMPTITTTDRNFMDSIEQLLSQAVGGTVEEPQIIDQKNEIQKIQEMIVASGNKTLPEMQEEAATLASNLVGVTINSATPKIPPTTTEVTTENYSESTTPILQVSDLLSESVGALLSQVYGLGSTTVEDDTTILTTTALPQKDEETTTIGTTTTEKPPHIINITIIRNEPKPAKADLSLEMEYEEIINELKKNGSLTPPSENPEVLKADASSSIHEEPNQETTTIVGSTEALLPVIVTLKEEDTTTEEEPSSTTPEAITTSAPSVSINSSTLPTISLDVKKPEEPSWTLVSTMSPNVGTTKIPPTSTGSTEDEAQSSAPVDLVHKPLQGFGLEDSTANLDQDIYQFVQLCNELAFGFWKSVTTGLSSARSVFVSPFAATSLLAMVFLGARGATSGEMNEILKLDDMVTFNPHLIFKNVSESIETGPGSGVAVAAIVRELYSDRSKGHLLGFYKERVKQFYDGHVEEAGFKEIGDVIRRRTNLLVKRHSKDKIQDFLKDSYIYARPPLAGISASIFQTDCSEASTEGRDGELYFVVLPSLRQRRLVPIPAAVWRSGFLAGYESSLDATVVALGTKDQAISTILVIPGQQGMTAPGDGLARLERHLIESSFKQGAWARLLRSLIPRPGVELQIPRFLHRSVINATVSLQRMGLKDLFDAHKADLRGLNGAAHDLHLSDIMQINEFATCGEGTIGEQHHKEVYPAAVGRRSRLLVEDYREEPRDYQRAFHDPLHDPSNLDLPLSQRPRQARLPEIPRLRFDRPFLYFIRHNPSGLILHMGRFHPRLLP